MNQSNEINKPETNKPLKSDIKFWIVLIAIILILVVFVLTLVNKKDIDYVLIQNPENPTEYKYIEAQKYNKLKNEAIQQYNKEIQQKREKQDSEERNEIMKNFKIPKDGDTMIIINGKVHYIKINKEDLKRFQEIQKK